MRARGGGCPGLHRAQVASGGGGRAAPPPNHLPPPAAAKWNDYHISDGYDSFVRLACDIILYMQKRLAPCRLTLQLLTALRAHKSVPSSALQLWWQDAGMAHSLRRGQTKIQAVNQSVRRRRSRRET